MERVEPIQPIKRVLPVRKAMSDYFDLELQYRKRSTRKWLDKNIKPAFSFAGFVRRALLLNVWIPRKVVI